MVTPHCYVKTTVTIFFLPRFIFVEKQGFSAMENYSFFFICEFNMVFCKANCSSKDSFRDRWVKLGNIKLYKYIVVFIFDLLEPVDKILSVFPLVKIVAYFSSFGLLYLKLIYLFCRCHFWKD